MISPGKLHSHAVRLILGWTCVGSLVAGTVGCAHHGSTARPEIANAVRTYHLLHSRNRVTSRTERVNRPRHFLLYRIRPDGTVEIGRVLHDSMDVVRHVPDDFGR